MSLTTNQHKPTPYSSSCMPNQRLQSLPPPLLRLRQILCSHSVPALSIPNYTWIKLNVAVLLHVQIHCCLILPVVCLVLIYSDWLASQQQAEEY